MVLVKASLTGSIIGNTLFVLGMSLVVGGLRNGHQRFDPRKASLNAAMMIEILLSDERPGSRRPGHCFTPDVTGVT